MTTGSRTVAIVQARMGSSRLPGKSLAAIGGRPMLWHVLVRAVASRLVDDVLLATTTNPRDDALASVATALGLSVYRGSEHDVLDRYRQAARQARAHVIVRLTADNPLNDPGVVDDTVALFRTAGVEYASNLHPRTFPRGLDVEVVTVQALETAWREAADPYDREHVTPYLYRTAPRRFTRANLAWSADLSGWRWTVDEAADLDFVCAVYGRLWRGEKTPFPFAEVVALVEAEPALRALCERAVEATSPRG